MSRRIQKANSLTTAWQALYQTIPSVNAAIMVCAVAEHETRCGDDQGWEGNWGAIQRRSMTIAEQALTKQGGVPVPHDAFEALHGDSSPINGKYKTWFWRFPANIVFPPSNLAGDCAGAHRLLQVLLNQRTQIRSQIDWINYQQLATLMYAPPSYYEGFHDPRKPGGKEANIADYARALTQAGSLFELALAFWTPGQVDALDLNTTAGVQRALNKLGDVTPVLVVDGLSGPKTTEAVSKFQAAHALPVNGYTSEATLFALRDALIGLAPGK